MKIISLCNCKRIRIRNKNDKRRTVGHFTPCNFYGLEYLQRFNRNKFRNKIRWSRDSTRDSDSICRKRFLGCPILSTFLHWQTIQKRTDRQFRVIIYRYYHITFIRKLEKKQKKKGREDSSSQLAQHASSSTTLRELFFSVINQTDILAATY